MTVHAVMVCSVPSGDVLVTFWWRGGSVAAGDDCLASAGLVREHCFGGFGDGGGLVPGDDHHAVGVTDDDIAGQDGDAAEGYGGSQPEGSVLVGAGGRSSPREDGHADLTQRLGVARCSVQREARDAEVNGALPDQFTQEGAGFIGAPGNHNDVSRTGQLQGG